MLDETKTPLLLQEWMLINDVRHGLMPLVESEINQGLTVSFNPRTKEIESSGPSEDPLHISKIAGEMVSRLASYREIYLDDAAQSALEENVAHKAQEKLAAQLHLVFYEH